MKFQAFKDSGCISTAHAANTKHWALWQHRTLGIERVTQYGRKKANLSFSPKFKWSSVVSFKYTTKSQKTFPYSIVLSMYLNVVVLASEGYLAGFYFLSLLILSLPFPALHFLPYYLICPILCSFVLLYMPNVILYC